MSDNKETKDYRGIVRAFAEKKRHPETDKPIKQAEAKEAVIGDFARFAKEVSEIRAGYEDTATKTKRYGVPLKFSTAIKDEYGLDVKSYLKLWGINTARQTLSEVGRRLGNNVDLTPASVVQLMRDNQTTPFASTKTFDPTGAFRWFIPEIIMEAIMLGYETGGLYQNWIAGTEFIENGTDEVVMPYVKLNSAPPTPSTEGSNAPQSRVSLLDKKVKVFQVKEKFVFSYRVLQKSKVDMLAASLMSFGQSLALQKDVYALDVLLNGDQADGSESAGVIGVTTSGEFKGKDILKAVAQLRRLGFELNTLVADLNNTLDIAELPEIKGSNYDVSKTELRGYVNYPPPLKSDIMPMPAGYALLVASEKAMVEFRQSSLLIESDRDIDSQNYEMVLSDYIGFGLRHRDARIVINKGAAFTSFPAFLNVDDWINNNFGGLV